MVIDSYTKKLDFFEITLPSGLLGHACLSVPFLKENQMGEILQFPLGSKIRSMVTAPLRWLAFDAESYFDEQTGRNHIYEISVQEIYNNDFKYSTLLSIPDPQRLNSWRKERGYNEDAFINKPTLAEITPLLRFLLGSCVVVSWNMEHELKIFPELRTMAYDLKCGMKRFADQFGDYSYEFNDRKYDKLKVAADKLGIPLNEGEFFHSAETDCRILVEVWKHLDRNGLPASFRDELILKNDAEALFLEVDKEVESLRQENISLHEVISKLELNESESDEDLPF
tara:strand:+ start:156 stop:1004 length:849 start_codon:yes stop_codon:yes gene_type:complete